MNKEKEIEKIKRAIAELVYEKTTLKKAYNYYHCKRDPEQFRHLEENYGLGTPTSVSFTPLIKKHIDVLVGEYLELEPDMQISCKDKETLAGILRDKQLVIDAEVQKYYKTHLENDIVNILIGGKEPTKDPLFESKLEELKKTIDRDYVSDYEIAAQNILEYIRLSRDIDLKNKAQEIFTDLLIGGVCYYDTKPTPGQEGLALRALNPLDTFIERNPNSALLNKSPRAVVRRWLTKDQILSEYSDELTEEAKATLRQEEPRNYEDSNSTYRHSPAPYIIAAGQETNGILGGMEALHLPDFDNDAYNSLDNYIRVYEVQWLEVDEAGVMQRHEGVQIGTEIYIARGVNDNVPRSISNPKDCSLSINGIFLNDKNGQPFSMILSTADLQDKYDLLIYSRDNLIASSGTVGDWIDLAHLPTVLGVELPERIQKWIAYKKQGVALFDSSQEGANIVNTTFNGYNDTVKGEAIQAIQLVIDSIEQQASSITGVFREKLGGIQQRDAVSNVKVGVSQSTLLTKQYFHAMDVLYKEINYDLLNLAKVVFKKGLQGQLILGPRLTKIFNILPEHFTATDFDIHIQDSTETFKVKETLQQMGPDLIKGGLADASLLVRMVLAKNASQLVHYVDTSIAEKKAENDQIGQLTQKLQEMEQQMQEAEKAMKEKDNQIKQLQGQIDKQAEDKLKLDRMRVMLEKQKIDNDKDTDDKLAKTKEEQLKIEWAQLNDGNPYNDKIGNI